MWWVYVIWNVLQALNHLNSSHFVGHYISFSQSIYNFYSIFTIWHSLIYVGIRWPLVNMVYPAYSLSLYAPHTYVYISIYILLSQALCTSYFKEINYTLCYVNHAHLYIIGHHQFRLKAHSTTVYIWNPLLSELPQPRISLKICGMLVTGYFSWHLSYNAVSTYILQK